jgi:hypothetical protein
MCCWLCTVYWRCALSAVPACTALQAGTAESSRLPKQRSTQSIAHSHSTIKCNLSVMITKKSSPLRWRSRVETCRSVLQLMIKLSFCICWWLVFFAQNLNFAYIAWSVPFKILAFLDDYIQNHFSFSVWLIVTTNSYKLLFIMGMFTHFMLFSTSESSAWILKVIFDMIDFEYHSI